YLSPDSYENLTARIIGMLLCIGAAVSGYWKQRAPRFFYFYCYFTIIYVLPFFFSFMLFMDGFGYIWSLSAVASLLLFALLFDTLNLFVGTVLGVSCAYILYYVKTGTIELPDQAFLAMPVMGFTLIMIRGVLAYNDHHVEKMKIHTAKALAGHIAHEMRTPLLGIQLDAKKAEKL
ncbi:hypothetical protein N9K16_05635, partial [Alphaproteobacteria bacterium]|nr:hypothetical protein [Alphaproteobacteria bacterium]